MKKILSMVLVLVLALSCMALAGVSAEESSFTPSEDPIIYFEVPEDWGSYKRIFCHIWELNNLPLASWQSKKERCTAVRGTDNLYSYDISVLSSFDETKVYGVIFSSDTGTQTYESLFSADCYGDTLYCDGTSITTPSFQGTKLYNAFWKNQDKSIYGPVMNIFSPGIVSGIALPKGYTTQDFFKEHISEHYIGPRDTDQTEIDLIASQLNFSKTTVERLLKEIHSIASWKKEASTLPILLGDANDDEFVNVKDVTTIQKHLAGFDSYVNDESADSDTNLSVNIKDATAIQKHIAGIEVGTPIGELYTFYIPPTILA